MDKKETEIELPVKDPMEIPEFLKRAEPLDKKPDPENDPVNVEHSYVQAEVEGGIPVENKE